MCYKFGKPTFTSLWAEAMNLIVTHTVMYLIQAKRLLQIVDLNLFTAFWCTMYVKFHQCNVRYDVHRTSQCIDSPLYSRTHEYISPRSVRVNFPVKHHPGATRFITLEI